MTISSSIVRLEAIFKFQGLKSIVLKNNMNILEY